MAARNQHTPPVRLAPAPDPHTQAIEGLPERQPYQVRATSGKLTQAQKRSKVLALRAAGGTHEQIAEVLTRQGHRTNRSGVAKIINGALEDLRAQDEAHVDMVRQLQLDRLDRMVAKLWPKVMEGHLKSIAEVRNIEQLRARIAGTEAPRKIEHSGQISHQVSREEVAQLEQAWVDSTAEDLDGVSDADLIAS